ncbi:GNAT family N-acetyltransferase [Streptomyces sp. CMB-StM0423]|uniref:GNAT family N-acetyltransferase n=1 Tax=Streptomyces sp. CMB-StM0423 TaxID=2059884 RepID=UPI000C705C5E|nr:GNAT family protein [Streptomyces sp. CMB-StM0423]AUH39688.1 RimJ/RimL family protein N-acetyltransferase [Streptomyces sp. CMB-StM0423]
MPENDVIAAGARTAIRTPRAADEEEFLARARASAELHHPWLSPPATPADYRAYLERLTEPQTEGFLVCERESGALAGFVNINAIVRRAFLSGALGYAAFVPYAGRGLMSEGIGLVVRHAFTHLGLHRLEINVQPGNAASIALAQRAGFRLEGFSPDYLFIGGAWRDHERWALTVEMTDVGGAPR